MKNAPEDQARDTITESLVSATPWLAAGVAAFGLSGDTSKSRTVESELLTPPPARVAYYQPEPDPATKDLTKLFRTDTVEPLNQESVVAKVESEYPDPTKAVEEYDPQMLEAIKARHPEALEMTTREILQILGDSVEELYPQLGAAGIIVLAFSLYLLGMRRSKISRRRSEFESANDLEACDALVEQGIGSTAGFNGEAKTAIIDCWRKLSRHMPKLATSLTIFVAGCASEAELTYETIDFFKNLTTNGWVIFGSILYVVAGIFAGIRSHGHKKQMERVRELVAAGAQPMVEAHAGTKDKILKLLEVLGFHVPNWIATALLYYPLKWGTAAYKAGSKSSFEAAGGNFTKDIKFDDLTLEQIIQLINDPAGLFGRSATTLTAMDADGSPFDKIIQRLAVADQGANSIAPGSIDPDWIQRRARVKEAFLNGIKGKIQRNQPIADPDETLGKRYIDLSNMRLPDNLGRNLDLDAIMNAYLARLRQLKQQFPKDAGRIKAFEREVIRRFNLLNKKRLEIDKVFSDHYKAVRTAQDKLRNKTDALTAATRANVALGLPPVDQLRTELATAQAATPANPQKIADIKRRLSQAKATTAKVTAAEDEKAAAQREHDTLTTNGHNQAAVNAKMQELVNLAEDFFKHLRLENQPAVAQPNQPERPVLGDRAASAIRNMGPMVIMTVAAVLAAGNITRGVVGLVNKLSGSSAAESSASGGGESKPKTLEDLSDDEKRAIEDEIEKRIEQFEAGCPVLSTDPHCSGKNPNEGYIREEVLKEHGIGQKAEAQKPTNDNGKPAEKAPKSDAQPTDADKSDAGSQPDASEADAADKTREAIHGVIDRALPAPDSQKPVIQAQPKEPIPSDEPILD